MLSILCVRLTIKVKVGIPESFKVGWYPPKKTGSSHLNQIHDHLVRNNLYPVAQSAYRRNHSTDTTLLKVMNGRYSVEYHDEQAAGYYPCFA